MNFVFDTETSGLVNMREAPDHPSQPHLVQLACMLLDDAGRQVQSASLIVKPEGWVIPKGAADVHGITTEYATTVGLPLRLVVATFTNMRAIASRKIAHNLKFDEIVMRAELARLKQTPGHPGPTDAICTMETATDLCAMPATARMKAAGFDKFKPPKLQELHMFLFKESFEGAHGALADCEACARCYYELKRREVPMLGAGRT